MSKRILILGGAGMMGSGTVRDLLSPLSSACPIGSIVAADSTEARLQQLKQDLTDPRLQTLVLDVSDPQALGRALQDCDLCINAVPTFAGHQMNIFEACLEARSIYVDYGGMGVFTVQQKARHQDFLQAGVMAVVGLGADPGMSNVICRAAADRLDRIDSIHLYWTSTRVGPESPVLEAAYSMSTILAEFANPSMQFFDGKLQEMPPQGGREVVELPQPWGPTEFIFSQHSEPLTVPFAAGIAEKGIREFTWRLALPRADHVAWQALVRAGFGDFDTPVTVPGGTVRPLDVLQAVNRRFVEARRADIPKVKNHEIHFAIGRGERAGMPTRVTVRVIGKPHPLYDDYIDATTSMNCSIGVQQILRQPSRAGVWAPEEVFEPAAYLAEVRRRHFEVSVETVIEEQL